FNNAMFLKKQRNKELLGKSEEEPISIMVTLDKTMLERLEIFKELLRAGMTIARINLAHDYSVWKQLVENIRAAEKELDDVKCKIYVDLPGPKIRVFDFRKIQAPLVIHTENNSPIGYLVSDQGIVPSIRHAF